MVMAVKTGIVQLKISRIMTLTYVDIGGDISGTCPPPFGCPKNLPCLDWKCSENGKKDTKFPPPSKGLFGEALFLTTTHLVVLVIIV